MCLITFAYKTHPDYPFVLAANRDEFHKRPAKPVHLWDSEPPIIAGKDLKAGGTWMGLNAKGHIAALTNYRKLSEFKENAPSRGEIVTRFLQSYDNISAILEQIRQTADLYNGFNLIAGSIDDLYYITNKKDEIQSVEPGYHTVSNAFLNTPWPKSEWARNQLQSTMKNGVPDEEEIFRFLLDTRRYPMEKLPETGLPEDLEKAVSSVFIQTENYGTRCSSVIYMDTNGEITFVERSFKPGTKEIETEERHKIVL